MIRFEHQNILYLLLLIPLLYFISNFSTAVRIRQLNKFSQKYERFLFGINLFKDKTSLFIELLALSILIIALAKPQWGIKIQKVKTYGRDIIIALDVSKSMLATDIKPNRLEGAKFEIASLLDKLQTDRIGLILFAGKAYMQCPLTLDYNAVKFFLKNISPNLIPEPGTNISDAIRLGIESLKELQTNEKNLIIITDGEDTISNPIDAAEIAAEKGIRIYTIGVGEKEGTPVPLIDEKGVITGYKKDREGNIVMSKLDEKTLRKIALITNGKYFKATFAGEGLIQVYNAMSSEEKKLIGSRVTTFYEERYQYFLIVVLFLIFFNYFINLDLKTLPFFKKL